MKKFVYVFLALGIVLSCKKSDSDSLTVDSDKLKLEEWFSKLAPNSSGLKKELKQKLKESLVLNESWKSNDGGESSLLIVPMNETYRLKNNADKQVKNFLTIEVDASGNYTSGFIWQVAAGSTITKSTFNHLSEGFETDLNGSYYKLDVWDNLISRMKFENGKRKSLGMLEARQSSSQRTSGLVCTEYYEVTTHYDIETGEIISQTSEYLYTSCICSSPNNVQSTILGPGDCDNSGGGSEGGTSCSELSQNFHNATFETSPEGTNETFGITSNVGDDYEGNHIFELGKYRIPIWVTYTFTAHNKVKLRKISATQKLFTDYIFGTTTKTGTSIFHSCSVATLSSSNRDIMSNGLRVRGTHFYNYKIKLIHESCPWETVDTDAGTTFDIHSSSY